MITYKDSLESIETRMLNGFFEGWLNPPSSETHFKILKNSDYIILAIDDEKQKVVGFITAISDHILSAFIPLLEVLLEYRNQGIGTELVKRMKKKLHSFYMIDLVCDKERQLFYEKLGMKEMHAMSWRNYYNQKGE